MGNGIVPTPCTNTLYVYWTGPYWGNYFYTDYIKQLIPHVYYDAYTFNPGIINRHVHLIFIVLIHKRVRFFVGQ